MLKVQNISYSYNNKDLALNDISFDIEDGCFLSIIGHNGSGKSTLAKLLMGLLENTFKGKVYYDDVELNPENIDKIRKKVGIVFQNPDNQFVGVNVKYDIAFGLENHNIERQEMLKLIDEYSKKVGMNENLSKEPQSLSGGQKQRVAIAGILALNVDYIILDEATSMLDPEGTQEIVSLIKELNTKYKKTIISITHDLNFASLSDKIIVLKNGKIIKTGKPEEILNDEETLISSSLDMPLAIKAYYEAKKNGITNNKIMEALWEYHFKK